MGRLLRTNPPTRRDHGFHPERVQGNERRTTQLIIEVSGSAANLERRATQVLIEVSGTPVIPSTAFDPLGMSGFFGA